jgi:hypothetical protein
MPAQQIEQTITFEEEIKLQLSKISAGKLVGVLLRNKELMYDKDKHYCWCLDRMGFWTGKGYIFSDPKEYEGKLEGKPCFHMIVFVRKG